MNGEIFAELAASKSEPKKLEIEQGEGLGDIDIGDESEGTLTVDVYKDGDNLVVESAVAGVSPDDLDINITNESVTIRGRRKKERKVDEKDFFYQELFWGSFSRSIILPYEVDPEKSRASFKDGVLKIVMPRLDKKKAKKLRVKID